MYEEFYNLKQLPFENTPDPQFFFQSEEHREALAAIEYTIRLGKGFCLITGDIGSGKTTVGQTLCDRLTDAAHIVSITHGHLTGDSVIRQVLRALNIKMRRDDDHPRLFERLRDYAQNSHLTRKPIVLMVDEAQTLSDPAMEELRLTCTLDTHTRKHVQIVLIGQPELRERIGQPKYLALRQRITMAKQLHAMPQEEMISYINHRLTITSGPSGAPGAAFDDSACNRIYQLGGGIPRLTNVICDNCLLVGMVRKKRTIDAEIVDHVAKDMLPAFDDASAHDVSEPPLALTGTF
jgi:type II secretory pathway predicted ATPase ExeA